MRHIDLSGARAGRQQCCVVDDIGNRGRRQADRVARQLREIQTRRGSDLAGVQAEQRFAVIEAGQADGNRAVEAAFTYQCRIERVGEVGGAQHQHAGSAIETVHLGEELVDDAVAFGIAGTCLLGALADAVDFVDEDDARRLLAGGAEQRLDLLDANAEIHRGEIAAGDLDEAGIRLTRQRLGQLGLACAGLAGQQHALGRAGAETGIGGRIAQVGGDVAERLLGLGGADDISEGHAAAFSLDFKATGLHGEEHRRADQQQGDR